MSSPLTLTAPAVISHNLNSFYVALARVINLEMMALLSVVGKDVISYGRDVGPLAVVRFKMSTYSFSALEALLSFPFMQCKNKSYIEYRPAFLQLPNVLAVCGSAGNAYVSLSP